MTSKQIIKRLISKGLIQIDNVGYYHCSSRSTPNTAVTINSTTTTLRRWIFKALYGHFPYYNLRTYEPSDLIDWRLKDEF